ncbi:MAG: hypothetical protein GC136_06660 [Alphaproteobacteria bacterium]|nr:hypothetical protein [Alphaproteobacteria bacterium]
MKSTPKILALSAVLAVLAAPAFAEDVPPPPPHDKGAMFKKIDKDGDGFATRAEMEAAHKEKLDKMFAEGDTDKDGKLSQEEMKTSFEKMKKKMREHMKDRAEEKPAE